MHPIIWMNDILSLKMILFVIVYVLLARALVSRIKTKFIRDISGPLFAISLTSLFAETIIRHAIMPAVVLCAGVFYLSLLFLELESRSGW